MKKLYTLLLITISTLSFGQVFYSESMGTTASGNPAASAYAGWQNTTPIAYTGTATMRTTGASSTYSGASGSVNAFFAAAGGQFLEISGINSSAYSTADLQLSFGYLTTTTSAQMVVEVSIDGSTWTPLTFTNNSNTSWNLITIGGSQIPATTNLRLRFTGPVTASGMRIDDIKIANISASCSLALSAETVACQASTSSLDNYTVTIPFTGGGTASYTINTSGTVSGDNPSSVASGNIVVTFIENSAYTINIIGGTCNFNVNGNSPECKTTNTLPYYDGFDYTVGNSLGAEQMWTNVNSGDNILVASGNLSYTGLTSNGNSIGFDGAGIDCFSPITQNSAGTVYYSFLMNASTMAGVTDANGGYLAGFGETSTNLGATLWTKRIDDTSYNLGIEVRTANAANTTFDATAYQTGQTYFVVVGYTFNAATTSDDIVSLWVNPVVGSPEPAATITDTHAATDLNNVSYFFLRQDSATKTPAVQIDELRIGTAWADVVPVTASLTDNNINGLTMYPNPLRGNTLYFNSTANADMSVQIYDVLGKEVVNSKVMNNTVNVSGLNAGVYIVKVTEEGKTATRKLVIQ